MNLEGVRILLIESNPGDARVLTDLVRKAGAGRSKLELAERLDTAIQRLSREQFDVILLDLDLPGSEGLDSVAQVHAHAPKLPIVVLATPDNEALAARAVRAGAQDYLIKGRISSDLLRRSVRYASEYRRTLETLTRREVHYRSLLENCLDLICILNVDGTIRYASQSYQRVLGYPLDELVGHNIFSLIHADDLLRVRAAFDQHHEATTVEYRFPHKDGSWKVLESSCHDLSHVPGVEGIVVNSRDLTERKRLEAQLHHSQRMEIMGRLAGGVAHDFNNLLMVITGHSQMLLDTMRPDDPSRDDLEQLAKAAERATDLTRQLLAFSRRQVVKPVLLNLNALIQGMDRMLRRVMGENVQIVMVLERGLNTVCADPGQIEQVLLNVALNARDAMPHGGTLTLETSNSVAGGPNADGYVVLSVNDTGSGMDSQVLSHVFEPFFTTKEHGTGLGLSTSYAIIQQSNGEISAESMPGAGTTFRIHLPVVETTSENLEASADGPPLDGTETILLVEDEEGVRLVVESMLKRHGYSVLSSGSTAEAMEVAEQHTGSIHLLITDVVLPGVSGRTLANHLVARRPEMRVLYVSGYGDHAGPADQTTFLQKPFSTAELALKIREALQSPLASAASEF